MVEASKASISIGTAIPLGGGNVKKKRDFNSTLVSEAKDVESSRVKKGCHHDGGVVAAGGSGRSGQRTKIQRENHILAERQRREEMNDKFCILRSLINKSSKKDKASIVGDTIDYILELERQLKHLQKTTVSHKCNKNSNNIEAANVRNYETVIRPKHASCDVNPPSLIANYTSSEDKSESAKAIKQVNQHVATSNSISDDTLKAIQSLQCEDQFSSAPSKPSSPSLGEQGRNEKGRDVMEGGNVQVEVQSMGKQAVVKVVCARSKGLVLRILAALDECKVDILQSNVTTLDHQVVHFLTIEMIPGASASVQEMENALRVAASKTWHSEQHVCATQHKLESKYAYHEVLHSIR